MSVVLAVRDGDKVWMATDSQFSRCGTKGQLVSPNLMKIWKVPAHKGMVMGLCGSLRDQNILSVKDSWYDPILDKVEGQIDFKFMVDEFVPTVMNYLTANSRTKNVEGQTMMDSCLLVAMNDQCYSIDADGCLGEASYDGEGLAIGSGADVALAAYRVLEDITEISIKEKLVRAVCQACNDDLYVNYPIIIMNTKDDSVEIFDGENYYIVGETEVEKGEEEEA